MPSNFNILFYAQKKKKNTTLDSQCCIPFSLLEWPTDMAQWSITTQFGYTWACNSSYAQRGKNWGNKYEIKYPIQIYSTSPNAT